MRGTDRSAGEVEFLLHVRLERLPQPEREYPFAKDLGRDWRFDFAWPSRRLALEVEGAVHRIKSRFSGDLEKYLVAQVLGWKVVRVSPKMIASALAVDVVRGILAAPSQPGEALHALKKHGVIPRTEANP